MQKFNAINPAFMREYLRSIYLLHLLLLFFSLQALAQTRKPEELGYRHLQTAYKQDTVDILIMSKKGEEQQTKPLFLFIQGSLPKPLLLLKGSGQAFQVFPFDANILLDAYHLAIISKPYVPLVGEVHHLKPNMAYVDPQTGNYPEEYIKRDHLDYYVNRNKRVIRFLKQQSWSNKEEVVVAGHSEGAAVAAKLAEVSPDVSRLIFASSNPFGRMATIISQLRQQDDSLGTATEKQFALWEELVSAPEDHEVKGEVTFKSVYSFSTPPLVLYKQLSVCLALLFCQQN